MVLTDVVEGPFGPAEVQSLEELEEPKGQPEPETANVATKEPTSAESKEAEQNCHLFLFGENFREPQAFAIY